MLENTIGAKWDTFRAAVVPAKASSAQLIETRRAFYAGAQSFLDLMWNTSGDEVSEDEGAQFMSRLNSELQAFAHDVISGKA